MVMNDVQLGAPKYNVSIEQVGISSLRYPVRILRKDNNYQHTIANISVSVSLPKDVRGTHMSRFIESIERHKHDINGGSVGSLLKDIQKTIGAGCASARISFPYFIEKRAPVSRMSSILETNCGFKVQIRFDGGVILGVHLAP